jgi:hypothetical protein
MDRDRGPGDRQGDLSGELSSTAASLEQLVGRFRLTRS